LGDAKGQPRRQAVEERGTSPRVQLLKMNTVTKDKHDGNTAAKFWRQAAFMWMHNASMAQHPLQRPKRRFI
jgi:hypothetical protein